jgi:DNA replication and repair protein RecF
VLLLDDVLSELDADRRARLVRAVRDVGQAIVTTTEAAHLPEPADRVLAVGDGGITLQE